MRSRAPSLNERFCMWVSTSTPLQNILYGDVTTPPGLVRQRTWCGWGVDSHFWKSMIVCAQLSSQRFYSSVTRTDSFRNTKGKMPLSRITTIRTDLGFRKSGESVARGTMQTQEKWTQENISTHSIPDGLDYRESALSAGHQGLIDQRD